MVSQFITKIREGLSAASRFAPLAMQRKNNFLQGLAALILVCVFLTACATVPAGGIDESDSLEPNASEPGPTGQLVIYSGRSEPLVQPVLALFNSQNPGVEILLKSGRNSELANALLEEQNNPQADVFITTELFTIQALHNAGVLQGYSPEAAADLPADAVGPDHSWVGLTRRARVIMYNTELVSRDEIPRSIFNLTEPRWKGQVASANSSNGSLQAQVAAMQQLVGEEATEEWLSGMLANNVTFFGGHTDVRKAVGSGEFKLGLVNHYYYYLQKKEGSPVGIVFPDQSSDQIGLITNFTAAGIVQGSKNLPAAQALIDFLLSPEGQELFASLNYEYPIAPGVSLHPEVEPLENYRLAKVDVSRAAQNLDLTFDLMDKVGIP